MSLWESFTLALKNIAASKMRALLTMLGIIIGIGAVMVILGFGSGMERFMQESFAELGTNTITVTLMSRSSSRTVTEEDMYALMEEMDTLQYISPTVSTGGSVKIGSETLSKTSSSGVGEQYLDIQGFDIAYGRGLNYMDMATRKTVCVIGNYLAEEYYDGDPLGKTLKIGSTQLTIVGVMEQEEDDMSEGGKDDCVYIPYTTSARMSLTATITSYTIMVYDESTISDDIDAIEDYLYDIFGSESYNVFSLSEILDMMNSMMSVMITVLSCIAGISLVVGGIGIMNIMLVSVTERTREIGVRKALGSKERYILQQFVMEAATTSALGGMIGIVMGYSLSAFVTSISEPLFGNHITVTPGTDAVAGAVAISIGIGILFGYLPAKNAAKLNPIDALRYD